MSSNLYKNRYIGGIDIAKYSVEELKKLVRKILDDKIHGVSFSPYVEGQEPGMDISDEQIRERLSIIAPYVNWVRTFSCTEGNEKIPAIAKSMGLKTLVGIWLDEDLENNEEEMTNAIELAKAGHVDMMGVGNEVMLRQELTQEQLIDYIERVKTSCPGVQAGYVDAYFLFEDYPAVADACDVLFANCYPFWEGYPAEHSLVYMKEMYRRAVNMGKGKKVIISETGWPNVGTPERQAIPSLENAIRYFINAYQWAEQEDIDIFYFSSFDEAWKVAAEGDVGAYWGLWDKDGVPKYG